MRPKLLVFDWDGTLMDSAARIVHCMQAAFVDLGLETPRAEAVENVIGLGLREAVVGIRADADEALVENLFNRYRHHFFSDRSQPSSLFPQVEETLALLDEAGYLMGVATGKGRQGLDLVLQETGLQRYFVATRCADETFSKPHPEMLNQLIDFVGVDPDETVMIGDTEYDLQMAVNAGVPSVAVSYGVHDRERLMQFNPLACISRIGQLPACLSEHI
jgi:phosphoglycolate phosphatase